MKTNVVAIPLPIEHQRARDEKVRREKAARQRVEREEFQKRALEQAILRQKLLKQRLLTEARRAKGIPSRIHFRHKLSEAEERLARDDVGPDDFPTGDA